ncbi:MAG TPA: FtsX-like permease family protein, partial [Xanthomonadaceae bacterium]|nr:FtsX-like permease family protein [Xanthomonadaceae bacterium]
LGFRSLLRNPVLTALMVITLGIGIAASMSTLTVLEIMRGNPIPDKSDRLIVPSLDNNAKDMAKDAPLPNQVSYLDATNLLAQHRAKRQTAIYAFGAFVESGRKDLPPFRADGMAPTHDFFDMFEVPFRYGRPWDADADVHKSDVAVITTTFAEKVFGANVNPVGRHLRFNDHDYTVSGVIGDWSPAPRYYRLEGNDAYGDTWDIMIPFSTAIGQEYQNNGSMDCNNDNGMGTGYAALLRSECVWIQYWAELGSTSERPAFDSYIAAYLGDQKKLGRFPRPLHYKLYNVMEWLDHEGVVGKDSQLQTWLAFGFLLVCLVNTVGLLLAKFTARGGEIGVRRALGAPKREIFHQFLIEAGVVGLAGGALGLVLSFGGLWLIAQQSDNMKAVAHTSASMLFTTIALAIGCSVLAGLLPTWRACQIRPAIQLKSQ